MAFSGTPDTTVVDEEFPSVFEKRFFYLGVSHDPPYLLQRSDAQDRPFEIPNAEDRHRVLPTKSVHCPYHPVLTPIVWKHVVGPSIAHLLSEGHNIRITTMIPVRFSVTKHGNPEMEEHTTIWISVAPGSTSKSCRDANADVLAILSKHSIQDVVIHWIESTVARLALHPTMLSVGDDTNPTFVSRQAITTALSVPIAPQDLKDQDIQGTLGIFFHEVEAPSGQASERVMGFTNKHVVSSDRDLMSNYRFPGSRTTQRQWVAACGLQRFDQMNTEVRRHITETVQRQLLRIAQIQEDNFSSPNAKARKVMEIQNAAQDLSTLIVLRYNTFIRI